MSTSRYLRVLALGYETFQKTRIAYMNQIRDIVRKKVQGIEFNEVEKKKETNDYTKNFTDKQLSEAWETLIRENKITQEESDLMYKCWNKGKDLIIVEKEFVKLIRQLLKIEPIYIQFLKKVKGIGEILSARIIKAFGDCSQYDTISKLWAHTGNQVIEGIAPKRRKGEKLCYSTKLRTLSYLISECLMKSNKGYYRELYEKEKEKQANKEYEKGYLVENYNGYKPEDIKLSKGHIHMRALRKIRKHFLSHYWEASRELIGLPHTKTYVEGVLNHDHIIDWKEAIIQENKLLEG